LRKPILPKALHQSDLQSQAAGSSRDHNGTVDNEPVNG
jgi:hypothetical protein